MFLPPPSSFLKLTYFAVLSEPVSPRDGRANRLADALSKAAAMEHRKPALARHALADAEAGASYGAALAGATTRATNAYPTMVYPVHSRT